VTGDVLILEEAAYCDEGFFYETAIFMFSAMFPSPIAILCMAVGTQEAYIFHIIFQTIHVVYLL